LYPAARRIKEHVESVKNLTFDAVTGATISSLFVRAAIKNAVANGQVLKIPD
jgi:Na+-translocating ferredoxin:NAD+ oxidoreductase RnfG subunit